MTESRSRRSDFGPDNVNWKGARMTQSAFLARLFRLHTLGWSQRRIAVHLGTSRACVKGCLLRMGVSPRPFFDRPYASGDRHHRWLGARARYGALHDRVRRVRGPATHCNEANCTRRSVVFEWANLTGRYEDPSDYRQMCRSCHRRYDRARRTA